MKQLLLLLVLHKIGESGFSGFMDPFVLFSAALTVGLRHGFVQPSLVFQKECLLTWQSPSKVHHKLTVLFPKEEEKKLIATK